MKKKKFDSSGSKSRLVDETDEQFGKAVKIFKEQIQDKLINFVSTTLVSNHIIENKDNILANIHNLVNAEYYNIYSTLSLYIIDGAKVSEYLNKEWINSIETDMINVIYNSTLSKEDKILAFTNKINIKIQSYITFIINNSIN